MVVIKPKTEDKENSPLIADKLTEGKGNAPYIIIIIIITYYLCNWAHNIAANWEIERVSVFVLAAHSYIINLSNVYVKVDL